MLPTVSNIEVLSDITISRQPNFTYKMLIEEERIIGDVDDIQAIEQACYKALNTERYKHIIYSWGYGIELADLFGKPIPYVFSELPRRIKETLLYDDRVEDVRDFDLSNKKNDVLAVFNVYTVVGVIRLQKGVVIA